MSFEVGYNMFFKLPHTWQWFELGHLQSEEKRSIISGPFGSNIGSRFFQKQGVPVIRGNNLSLNINIKFIDSGFVFLSEEKANELNAWAVVDDILFTAAGTIGQVGLIGRNTKYRSYIISNKQIRVRLNVNKILPLYAYYWLNQPLMIEYIQQRNTGSTIPLINLSVVKALPIAVPGLNYQKKVTSILSSLDDKIELNRQTNQILEAIAQAIFKEWFVDFNFPGATGEMQDSEVGGIPKGWKAGKLGDICELIYGKALKAETRIKGEYPVVGSSGIVGFHNDYLVEAPGIVIGRKGTIGEVTWLHKNFFPIDTTFYINDKIGTGGLYYHYFLLKAQDFKKITSDSAVPGLNRNQAMDNSVVIPSVYIINQFEDISKGIFEMIFNNEDQIQTLTQLRDTLLPKLMKGEISIPES